MDIIIQLTEAQEVALLTRHRSIEAYVQSVVENRANRIIDNIVRDCADGKTSTEALTKTEQAVVEKVVADKIVAHPDRLPREVKALIVKKAKIPTMVEKIAAQEKAV